MRTSVDLPVLVVELSSETRDCVVTELERLGFPWLEAPDFASGIKMFHSANPWLIVTPLSVVEAGRALLDQSKHHAAVKLLCVTTETADPRRVSTALRAGVRDVVAIPRDLAELCSTIEAIANGRDAHHSPADSSRATSLKDARRQGDLVDRRHLERCLHDYGGNVSQVARRLGKSRATVYRLMRKHGLTSESSPSATSVKVAAVPDTEGSSPSHAILVIDDLEHKRIELANALSRIEFRVDFAEDCLAGLEAYQRERHACIVTDLKTPRMDGLEMVEQIRADGGTVPIVLISGFATVSLAVAAMKRGVEHVYRYEELDLDELASQVEQLAKEHIKRSRQ